MGIFEMINSALGPICTTLIMCIFICGVLIPMFRVLLLKGGTEEEEDEAVLHFEIMLHQDVQMPEVEAIDNTKGIDVHDHTVQESLVKSFAKLRDCSGTGAIGDDRTAEIKRAIFDYAKTDVETSERAYATLRTMLKYNGKLSSINTDELTVLNMVWARIMDPINSKVQQDLKENLAKQLSEASLTLDMSRCLSGRIARIIQSLEAIDAENIVNIASTEDIRRELSDKVPLLLSRYEGEDPKTYVDQELRKDYVDTKLLTETEYLRIAKDYLDAC